MTVKYRQPTLETSQRIVSEHKLLLEAIEHTPIPFAVYDQDDYLIVWNEPYANNHGGALQALRQVTNGRIHYKDLVRAIAEQLPEAERSAYIQQRLEQQRNADGVAVDRYYPNTGWMRISKFITPSGAVAGFAIDINELREREDALRLEIERRKKLEAQLRNIANTDALTEIPNRRSFMEAGDAEYARWRDCDAGFAVVMLDIDRFKSVNDSYGHQMGDEVIRQVARSATTAARAKIDVVGRLGGEEFGVLLPRTQIDSAAERASRIRKAVAKLSFGSGDARFGVTASLGVTEVTNDDSSFSDVVNRADKALYSAKRSGRNWVSSIASDSQLA